MSHKCAWCHISPGTISIHQTLQKNQLFCKTCHNDYLKMTPSLKIPAGIIPCCRLKDSGENTSFLVLKNLVGVIFKKSVEECIDKTLL